MNRQQKLSPKSEDFGESFCYGVIKRKLLNNPILERAEK